MKQTLFLFEHGINSVPSNWRDWTNRARQHVNINTPHKSDSLEYFCGAIGAHFRHHSLAMSFSKMLRHYSTHDFEIVIVAHSNGTRIVLEGMKMAGWPRVKALHLVCGACDGNFVRNGLAFAMRAGQVGEVFAYIAGRDRAMKIEDTILGRWLFGVRTRDEPLGLVGPRNVPEALRDRVRQINWPTYGHSDCWLPKNFEQTMREFV